MISNVSIHGHFVPYLWAYDNLVGLGELCGRKGCLFNGGWGNLKSDKKSQSLNIPFMIHFSSHPFSWLHLLLNSISIMDWRPKLQHLEFWEILKMHIVTYLIWSMIWGTQEDSVVFHTEILMHEHQLLASQLFLYALQCFKGSDFVIKQINVSVWI
jgi:hypothetical protein